jgi:hypothetical protein
VTDEQLQAPGRVPGKYVVIGLGAFGVVFLGFVMLLALKLDPAADRFHNPTRAAATK